MRHCSLGFAFMALALLVAYCHLPEPYSTATILGAMACFALACYTQRKETP